MAVVVVAFYPLARILGECLTIYFLPTPEPDVAQRAEATVAECSLTSCV